MNVSVLPGLSADAARLDKERGRELGRREGLRVEAVLGRLIQTG